jgi:hypothetical protein
MAVAVEMTFKGATTEQYDKVMELMGLSPGAPGPRGALFHWCAATDDGLRITDVWESEAEFGKFAEEQIGPYSAQAGIPNPPEVVFTPLHNYFLPG